jgi:hypothetical protein
MPDEQKSRPVSYGVSDPFLKSREIPAAAPPPSEHADQLKGIISKPPAAAPVAAEPAAPMVYRSFLKLTAAEQAASTPQPQRLREDETETRAVWIVHGMGQQIKFATLDSLTEGILSVAELPLGATGFQPNASSIRVGDEIVQRVEVKVRSSDGKRNINLHLYEAYWAPLTEGVAKLTDVVGFLVDGALRGILNSFGQSFKRAMFGDVCEFKIKRRVPLYISAILLMLGSLAVINGVVLLAAGSKVSIVKFDPLKNFWPEITSIASAMCALAISLGAILFLAESCKARNATRLRQRALSWISWLGVVFSSVGIVAAAGIFALAPICARVREVLRHMHWARLQSISTVIILSSLELIGLALTARAKKRSEKKSTLDQSAIDGEVKKEKSKRQFVFALLLAALLLQTAAILSVAVGFGWAPLAGYELPDWLLWICLRLANPLWVWPFLIFLSSQVRTLMVQYVGDVAIYVTSNKIDRFSEVREKIKDVAYKSASSVYHAMMEHQNSFAYEKIAIIGHSLGSEIAYDTLNRLINEDRLAGGTLRIPERTCLLETFGSPLNKIAFFFTIQGTDTFQIREQLAETVQPLLMNYAYRPFPWINIHSGNDIISGDVYLYDWPAANSDLAKAANGAPTPTNYNPAEENFDLGASVALVAHVDYWKNKCIWQKLYKKVTE